MAVNPLERSIREAVRLNKELGRLFAHVGSSSNPRGRIMTAYRAALRALRNDTSPAAVRDTMRNLRNQVHRDALALMMEAAAIGHNSAIEQVGYYGKAVRAPAVNTQKIAAQADVIAAQVEAQAASAVGLAVSEREDELIYGTDTRPGVVRPAPIVSSFDIGLATLMGAAMSAVWDATANTNGFQKQAIAALDSHTTECCLKVHGQVQPLDGLFHLTGDPRFADDMDWSPFHWNCRTSIALYKPEYDNGLTDRMRSSADYVLGERAAGRTPDQWPVDAFFEG